MFQPSDFSNVQQQSQLNSDKLLALKIIKGGFSINLTNEAHSVIQTHIWLTRAALILRKYCELNLSEKELSHLFGLTKQEIDYFISNSSDEIALSVGNKKIAKVMEIR